MTRRRRAVARDSGGLDLDRVLRQPGARAVVEELLCATSRCLQAAPGSSRWWSEREWIAALAYQIGICDAPHDADLEERLERQGLLLRIAPENPDPDDGDLDDRD